MTDKEKAKAYEELERWTRAMQRPMLMLRAAVGAARAGIDLPDGRKVEDEMEAVWDGFMRMPGALLANRPLSPLSAVSLDKEIAAVQIVALDMTAREVEKSEAATQFTEWMF